MTTQNNNKIVLDDAIANNYIKGFYYVCLSCGKTKNKVNKDGECMECEE